MEKFKVGDIVERINYDSWNVKVGEIGEVIEIGSVLGNPKVDFAGKTSWHDSENLRIRYVNQSVQKEVVKNNNTNNSMITNLVNKFKILTAPEPERTFIEAGIMNSNSELTKEGKELFDCFLFEKLKDDFKTEVVDVIIAAKE